MTIDQKILLLSLYWELFCRERYNNLKTAIRATGIGLLLAGAFFYDLFIILIELSNDIFMFVIEEIIELEAFELLMIISICLFLCFAPAYIVRIVAIILVPIIFKMFIHLLKDS